MSSKTAISGIQIAAQWDASAVRAVAAAAKIEKANDNKDKSHAKVAPAAPVATPTPAKVETLVQGATAVAAQLLAQVAPGIETPAVQAKPATPADAALQAKAETPAPQTVKVDTPAAAPLAPKADSLVHGATVGAGQVLAAVAAKAEPAADTVHGYEKVRDDRREPRAQAGPVVNDDRDDSRAAAHHPKPPKPPKDRKPPKDPPPPTPPQPPAPPPPVVTQPPRVVDSPLPTRRLEKVLADIHAGYVSKYPTEAPSQRGLQLRATETAWTKSAPTAMRAYQTAAQSQVAVSLLGGASTDASAFARSLRLY